MLRILLYLRGKVGVTLHRVGSIGEIDHRLQVSIAWRIAGPAIVDAECLAPREVINKPRHRRKVEGTTMSGHTYC